jgi:hypothetical protein
MAGRLRIMTIITGVTSPYILGKSSHTEVTKQAVQVADDLGIDMVGYENTPARKSY